MQTAETLQDISSINHDLLRILDKFRDPLAKHIVYSSRVMRLMKRIFAMNTYLLNGEDCDSGTGYANSYLTLDFLSIPELTPTSMSGRAIDSIIYGIMIQEFGTQNHAANNLLFERKKHLGVREQGYGSVFNHACSRYSRQVGMLGLRDEPYREHVSPENPERLQAWLDCLKYYFMPHMSFNFVRYMAEAVNTRLFEKSEIVPYRINGKVVMFEKMSHTATREKPIVKAYTLDAEQGLERAVLRQAEMTDTTKEHLRKQGDLGHVTVTYHPKSFVLAKADIRFDIRKYLAEMRKLSPNIPVKYIASLQLGSARLAVAAGVSLIEADYEHAIEELQEAYRISADNIDALVEACEILPNMALRKQGPRGGLNPFVTKVVAEPRKLLEIALEAKIEGFPSAKMYCEKRDADPDDDLRLDEYYVSTGSDAQNILLRRTARMLYYELGQREQAIGMLVRAHELGKLDGDNYLQLAMLCAREVFMYNTACRNAEQFETYLKTGLTASRNEFNKGLVMLNLRYLQEMRTGKSDFYYPGEFYDFIGKELKRQNAASMRDQRFDFAFAVMYYFLGRYYEVLRKMAEHASADVRQRRGKNWERECRMLDDEVRKYKEDIKMMGEHAWVIQTNANYHCSPARVPLSREGDVFFMDFPEIVGLYDLLGQAAFKQCEMDEFLAARAVLCAMDERKAVAYLSLFETGFGEKIVLMNKASQTLDAMLRSNISIDDKRAMTKEYLLVQEEVQHKIVPRSSASGGIEILCPVEDKKVAKEVEVVDYKRFRTRYMISRREGDLRPRLAELEECDERGEYKLENTAVNEFIRQSDRFIAKYLNLGIVPASSMSRILSLLTCFTNLDTSAENCLILTEGGNRHVLINDWRQHGIAPCVYSYAYTLADPVVNRMVFGSQAYCEDERRMIYEVLGKRQESTGVMLEAEDYRYPEEVYKAFKVWACLRTIFGTNSRLNKPLLAEEYLELTVPYMQSLSDYDDSSDGRAFDSLGPEAGTLYSLVNAVMQTMHQNLQTTLLRVHPHVVERAMQYADRNTRQRIEENCRRMRENSIFSVVSYSRWTDIEMATQRSYTNHYG